jgi:hypothetical protein
MKNPINQIIKTLINPSVKTKTTFVSSGVIGIIKEMSNIWMMNRKNEFLPNLLIKLSFLNKSCVFPKISIK